MEVGNHWRGFWSSYCRDVEKEEYIPKKKRVKWSTDWYFKHGDFGHAKLLCELRQNKPLEDIYMLLNIPNWILYLLCHTFHYIFLSFTKSEKKKRKHVSLHNIRSINLRNDRELRKKYQTGLDSLNKIVQGKSSISLIHGQFNWQLLVLTMILHNIIIRVWAALGTEHWHTLYTQHRWNIKYFVSPLKLYKIWLQISKLIHHKFKYWQMAKVFHNTGKQTDIQNSFSLY